MSEAIRKANELEDRLLQFAVRAIKLTAALPRSEAGNHVAKQLLRCGTSPAPNYGEARGAESQSDFIHKLKIILKELNESRIWLRMIGMSELAEAPKLAPLLTECEELSRIIAASIVTAQRNLVSRRRPNGKSQMANHK